MELNRLKRVIRQRWWVVLLIAVIGFIGGFGFTLMGNRDIQVTHQATRPLVFEPGEGETVEALEDQVSQASLVANFAAEDLLQQYPGSSIFADLASGQLIFRATADTPQEALAIVNDLVTVYFQSDPTVGGDLEGALADLRAEAEELSALIDAMQPGLTDAERAVAVQHDILDLRADAIRSQIANLAAQAAQLGPDESEDIQAQIEELAGRLAAISSERALLGPRPIETLTPAEALELQVLQARLEIVQLDYERFALRAFGVGEQGRLEPASVQNLTPEPANAILNGVLGMLLGSGLAVLALALTTRSRREIWLAEDVPIPVLGEVPLRRTAAAPGASWYDTTVGGSRKDAIQATRTALDGLIDPSSDALSLSGHSVAAGAVHALAVDLAVSFASAGRTVLLIDAAFDEPVTVSEYEVGEPSLGRLLREIGGSASTDAIDAALDDVIHIRTDLAVMPAGSAPESPADALAGRGFRAILAAARERFDLVLVVAGEADQPTAQVVSQRVGAAVVAVTVGRSTRPQVNSILTDLDQQRVFLPGVVMLNGVDLGQGQRVSTKPVPRIESRRNTRRRSAPSEPVVSTSARLGSYPFPGAKRALRGNDGSLEHLSRDLQSEQEHGEDDSERVGAEASRPSEIEATRSATRNDDSVERARNLGDSGDAALGRQVLEALRSAHRSAAWMRVADYVVARVEDILTAVPGQDSLSDELINLVATDGFIAITGASKHMSIGQCFVAELEGEVGADLATEIMETVVELLGESGESPTEALNTWIGREFFPRHIERTQGAPEIWQISSSQGSVKLLVPARRLTEERLRLITTDVVRRRINELEREVSQVIRDGDQLRVTDLEARLRELHEFEVSLGLLRGGGSEEARLHYPWRSPDNQPRGWQPIWTEGIEANIAPLQRLGLLSTPVLSDDQLRSTAGTG